MRSRTLIALAVAGSFACGGAFAAGTHEGSMGNSTEIQTPSSVSESAPWLTGQPHLGGAGPDRSSPSIGFQEGQFSDGPYSTGASSDVSGSGSGGYDTSMSDVQPGDGGDAVAAVDYWLLGDEPAASGASSSLSAAGSGGFDSTWRDTAGFGSASAAGADDSDGLASMSEYGSDPSYDAASMSGMSGEPLAVIYTDSAEQIADTFGDTSPFLSEHYLIRGPLTDGQDLIVLELGPAPEDLALLDSLSRDFYVLTPIYDEG